MKTKHRRAAKAKRWQKNLTSWICTIVGNKDQQEENATRIMNEIRLAFELLKSGQALISHFDTVACALNVGLARAELIDALVEETMQKGIDAMYSCFEINERHGRYGFTGPDILAVTDAINWYDSILRLSTPRMMNDAANAAHKRCAELARKIAA